MLPKDRSGRIVRASSEGRSRSFPTFDKIVNLWWIDLPMGIFDIALSCWLLSKRFGQRGVAEA